MENSNRKGVIYARTSSSGSQEGRQNTERQVIDLNRYADTAGIEVVKVFEEHISGALKNGERPVLQECLDFCFTNHVSVLMVSELSRLGRNAFEVLSTVQSLIDHKIDLYCQKEQFHLLGDDGRPSMLAPIMIAVLGTCAQLERENIMFRLRSGYNKWLSAGKKPGRKVGWRMPIEQREEKYADAIRLIRKGGYTLQEIAKLSDVSVSTVQRLKKELSA